MTPCLECRAEIGVPPCGQTSTTFEVRTRVDAQNARALVELR